MILFCSIFGCCDGIGLGFQTVVIERFHVFFWLSSFLSGSIHLERALGWDSSHIGALFVLGIASAWHAFS